MGLWELLLIAVSLSMDAFAISICKGLALEKLEKKHMIIVGAYFGGFQALMPIIGYVLGEQVISLIDHVDHWIVFGILGLIGANMIREAFSEEEVTAGLDVKTMLLLAVATSIDALAIGVSFALMYVRILPSALLIGCTTFSISAFGVYVGSRFGTRYKRGAEILGGVVLIILGTRILLQGLGII